LAAEQGLHHDFVRPGRTLLAVLDADTCGRGCRQGKPRPEIFLTAASGQAAPADACLVVEDSASRITAAKAGGMAALGVARAVDV
jgi:beta-phosphoglucomutase-like phosphatase (HAD superfamily)